MVQEGVIYTDGREVKVTPYQFIVGSKEYLLDGITKIRFLTLHKSKVPAIFLVLLGVGGMICGWFGIFGWHAVELGNYSIALSVIVEFGGALLVLIGVVWLAAIHDHYAVRITTADGDKDAIVSRKRDYINQIVYALHEAVDYKFE